MLDSFLKVLIFLFISSKIVPNLFFAAFPNLNSASFSFSLLFKSSSVNFSSTKKPGVGSTISCIIFLFSSSAASIEASKFCFDIVNDVFKNAESVSLKLSVVSNNDGGKGGLRIGFLFGVEV